MLVTCCGFSSVVGVGMSGSLHVGHKWSHCFVVSWSSCLNFGWCGPQLLHTYAPSPYWLILAATTIFCMFLRSVGLFTMRSKRFAVPRTFVLTYFVISYMLCPSPTSAAS